MRGYGISCVSFAFHKDCATKKVNWNEYGRWMHAKMTSNLLLLFFFLKVVYRINIIKGKEGEVYSVHVCGID